MNCGVTGTSNDVSSQDTTSEWEPGILSMTLTQFLTVSLYHISHDTTPSLSSVILRYVVLKMPAMVSIS